MAREIKDEKQMEGAEGMAQEVGTPQQPSSIQLPLSEGMQESLVQIVMEDYHSAKDARDNREYGKTSKGEKFNFERWMKALRDLYTGEREPKEVPWKYCSNRSLKIAAAILDLLHSRMFPAIVNEDLTRWRPGELTDVPKVERISKFMKWWVWVHSALRQAFDIWVKLTIGYGDSLTESFWKVKVRESGEAMQEPVIDPTTGQPSIDPATGQPMMQNVVALEREETTDSRVYLRDQFLLQKNSMDIESEPVVIEEEFPYRDLEMGEMEGKFTNISTLLRNKIPFQEPVTGTVSDQERESLRDIRIRNFPVKLIKEYLNFDADGDGFPERVRVYISEEYEIYLGGVKVRDLTKSGKQPLTYAKFDNRIDKAHENYGEGVLEKIRELSEEIDAIFNQMNDGNTLSLMMPGFYDPGGDIDAPALKIAPNKITPVSRPQENLFFPTINVPTDKLILAIRMVLEFIERLTAASSYVLGKESEIVGGSGTATRTQAIVQSAEQRFSIFAERLREGAARIITQHLDLVQLNIPPGLETRVLGEKGEPLFGENELTQEGISGKFDAYILLDPSMGSKQAERDLASMFYSLLLQNVLVGTDPVKIYKVTADLMRAYGKDPEEYLGPEPDFDQIDSPEDENTLVIQGDFARVKANIAENHILHIKVHQDLMNSPSLAGLPPHLMAEVQTFMQQHIQEHTMMMQIMIGMMKKFGSGGGEGGINGDGEQGGASKGAPGSPGLENIPGPFGQVNSKKREGEVGSPSAG